MKLKILILVFTAILVLSCKNNSEDKDPNIRYLSDTLKISPKDSKKCFLSDILKEIKYIKLENGENCMIGQVSQLDIFEDKIFILDTDKSKAVFCFTIEGKFLFKIDKKGNGPGEYIQISGFSIDRKNKHLIIFDNRKRKIIKYGMQGNFLEESPCEYAGYRPKYIGDGVYAFSFYYSKHPDAIKNSIYYNLALSKNGSNLSRMFLPYPSTCLMENTTSLYKNYFNYSLDTVGFYKEYDYHIYHLSPKSVSSRYFLDFGKYTLPENFLIKYISDNTMSSKLVREHIYNEGYCTIRHVIESEDILYLIYFQKDIPYILLYSKKTGKRIHAKGIIENDLDGGSMFDPTYYYNGGYYSTIYPYNLLKLTRDENEKSGLSDELKGLIDNMSEYDNPVIMVGKFKEI